MKIKKLVYLLLGCLGLGLGAVGAVLPMLPAFPFLMLAACCFAKSSARLDRWFRGTKLYKDNLESYIQGRGMTWQAKRRIMLLVTALMSVGFVIMAAQSVWVGCAGWRMGVPYCIFYLGDQDLEARISRRKAGQPPGFLGCQQRFLPYYNI